MYTGDYEEQEGQVQGFEGFDANPHPTDKELKIKTDAQVAWSLKASILAWLLGQNLQAVTFQNHAMARLFAALSRNGRNHPKPQINVNLIRFVHRAARCTALHYILDDFVVRNWGDKSAVEQDDAVP
jgi:hypothetical protein